MQRKLPNLIRVPLGQKISFQYILFCSNLFLYSGSINKLTINEIYLLEANPADVFTLFVKKYYTDKETNIFGVKLKNHICIGCKGFFSNILHYTKTPSKLKK